MEFQKSSNDDKFNSANHHDANDIRTFKNRIKEDTKLYGKPLITPPSKVPLKYTRKKVVIV